MLTKKSCLTTTKKEKLVKRKERPLFQWLDLSAECHAHASPVGGTSETLFSVSYLTRRFQVTAEQNGDPELYLFVRHFFMNRNSSYTYIYILVLTLIVNDHLYSEEESLSCKYIFFTLV